MQASGYLRPLLHARSAGGRKIEMWMRRKQWGINPPAIKIVHAKVKFSLVFYFPAEYVSAQRAPW